jgi:hypothetical protein
MNLDQFIKYYTDYKNLKTLNYYLTIYNCPVCNQKITNSNHCNSYYFGGDIVYHRIILDFTTSSIYLFFDGYIDYVFFRENFDVTFSNKEILKSLYYKDFGEVTLEKLKSLESNLLFL